MPGTRLAIAMFFAPVLFGQDAAELYRKGVDLQRAGDLNGAASAYRESLARDGSNIAAHSNLGAALAGLGRYDEAIPEYKKAIEGASDQVRPILRRNLGLAYFKSGRLDEAAPILIGLNKAEPSNRDAALLAADCMLQLGEPGAAAAILEPLAPEAAGDKAFAYALGMAYLKTGRATDAQKILDPILKDESSPEGQYALGVAMFSSGDYPSALRALQHAIALNAGLPHLQSYYGQALVFTGDPDAALDAFQKELTSDQNDYEANFESALILNRRSRFAESERLARRAAQLRPKSAAARLALADALIGLKETAQARAELEAVAAEWPGLGAAHARLAVLYANAGHKPEAAREQALAAKLAPKDSAPAAGPAPGSPAPRFELARSEGGGTVAIPASGSPTVLVFGSYTCPNFRQAAPVLNELSLKLGGRVSFVQVYIREAHATGQWQSTINERDSLELPPAAGMDQKHDYAMMCQRKLHLRFPAVVDGMDNAAEKAYAAWPSRVYVIDGAGRVRYSSALNEEEFDRRALENAIRSVSR